MQIGRNVWKLVVLKGRQLINGRSQDYALDPREHTATVVDVGSPARLAEATARAVRAIHRQEGFFANTPNDPNVSLFDPGDDLPRCRLHPDVD